MFLLQSTGVIFFLEHAGELRIIVLVEENESYIDPNTHPHLRTFPDVGRRTSRIESLSKQVRLLSIMISGE